MQNPFKAKPAPTPDPPTTAAVAVSEAHPTSPAPPSAAVAPSTSPGPVSTLATLSDLETTSLMEIQHPSKAIGDSIYGQTKVFPDYQAEPGESYLGMVHGIAHESSVSFVAVLLGIRAVRKGFDTALYFFGIGSLNCLATRGFPTIGNELFPGMRNENGQLEKFMAEGGKVYACRLGLSLHGAREEDLMEGVIPCHPLDMQDAMIEYARKGAIINTTWMF